MTNGHKRFIAQVIKTAKCTRKQAEKVFKEYKKNKIITCDVRCTGTWSVKHGVFWDKEVLWNAINI
jgi:hypothetical protein